MSILHPTKLSSVVQPKYAGRFACIGAECEDNCCTGWTVSIDKKTFNTYRQSQNTALAERFDSKLSRTRALASDKQYARIDMLPQTAQCPFMEEKLCSIQREMGEDKLSDTCATYPRSHLVMGDIQEQALTLSCPQAARLALLQDDALEFEESTVRVRTDVVSTVKAKHGLSLQTMGSVRVFCIGLLKNQELALWQRLAVLAMFCESLTQSIRNSRHADIPDLLEQMEQMVASGQVQAALDPLVPDPVTQANVFSQMWQLKIRNLLSPVQEQVQKAIAQGLGADPVSHEVSSAQLVERYSQGVTHLPQALVQAPKLLENYLVNEMFRETFPFGSDRPYDHFMTLITRFGLLRLMLAAQCSDTQQLPTPEQMARTVQVFCRLYQHDTKFATSVNSALKKNGWDSLEKIYRFLRS